MRFQLLALAGLFCLFVFPVYSQTDPCPEECATPGDFDGDHLVGVADLVIFLGLFQLNYDPDGDGIPDCAGCTDPWACNFDEEATVDDGSCTYPVLVACVDEDGDGLGNPNLGIYSCFDIECEGEPDVDPLIELDAFVLNEEGDTLSIAAFSNNGCGDCIDQCDDLTACNFDDPNNEPCYYDCSEGCMAPGACNYDPNATTPCDGCCVFEYQVGCVDVDKDGLGDPNFPVFICPGDPVPPFTGPCEDLCDDTDACNYFAPPNVPCLYLDACGVCGGNGTSCVGCTDPDACNYDSGATIDDGTCYYEKVWGCEDTDGDGWGNPSLPIYSCDPVAAAPCLDECEDFSACNYIAPPNEPCEYLDDCGVCGGDGECDCIDSTLIDEGLCMILDCFTYDPVCGCNGVTYFNDCYPGICDGVTSWTAGPCESTCDPEDFEGYPLGGSVAQLSPDFATWNVGQEGTVEDAPIVSDYAFSGSQSVKLQQENTGGGPSDIVYLVNGTSGTWHCKWMMYVEPTFGAYFNVQGTDPWGESSSSWQLTVRMATESFDVIAVDPASGSLEFYSVTPFQGGTWLEYEVVVDVDAGLMDFYVDGTQLLDAQPFSGIFKGVNFYAYSGLADPDGNKYTGLYFLDDICAYPEGEEPPTTGCLDPDACNYEPDAAMPCDGCCEYEVLLGCFDADKDGCGDPNFLVFGCPGTTSDAIGPCTDLCDDPDACNSESCTEPCYYDCSEGCMALEACNYDPNATTPCDGCCVFEYQVGCVDVDKDGLGDPNFPVFICPGDPVPSFTGPCEDLCDDTDACNYFAPPNVPCLYLDACGVCGGNGTTCLGCTDPEACNYDSGATIDDGTCYFEKVWGCEDTDGDGWGNPSLPIYSCDPVAAAPCLDECEDFSACNYIAPPNEPCEYLDDCGVCGGDGGCTSGCDPEDFEGYPLGSLIAASSTDFATWVPGSEGTSMDAPVVSTQAYSGSRSVKIEQEISGGGPTDVIYLVEGDSGTWHCKWQMYVEPGFGGYFNIQATDPVGQSPASWQMSVNMSSSSSDVMLVNIDSGSESFIGAPFNSGVWQQYEVVVDVEAGLLDFYLAGTPVLEDETYTGIFQAVNFYAYSGILSSNGTKDFALYYVDDICAYSEGDEPPTGGCLDPVACNYEPDALEPCSNCCTYPQLVGCIDEDGDGLGNPNIQIFSCLEGPCEISSDVEILVTDADLDTTQVSYVVYDDYGCGECIDNCDDPLACNYDDPANLPCEYPSSCEPVTFDGYTYDVVEIGGHCWFAEDLITTTYRNGDPISGGAGLEEDCWVTEEGDWFFGMAPVNHGGAGDRFDIDRPWLELIEMMDPDNPFYDSCTLEDIPASSFVGYSVAAVSDSRGLCPSGWHVSTDEDWMDLESSLGMDAELLDSIGGRPVDINPLVKECAWPCFCFCDPFPVWLDGSPDGLKLEPSYASSSGACSGLSDACDIQSAVFSPSVSGTMMFRSVYGGIYRDVIEAEDLQLVNQVRCVQDSDVGCDDCYTPANPPGTDCPMVIDPVCGCDGVTYDNGCLALNAVASFTEGPCSSQCNPVSLDGYQYDVVQVGNQCWFAENLRTSTYSNGDEILSGLDYEDWFNPQVPDYTGKCSVYGEAVYYTSSGSTDPYFCVGDSVFIDVCDPAIALEEYGRLYNWYAIADLRGLCPVGWRVSTDEDWKVLESFMGLPPSELEEFGIRGEAMELGTQLKAVAGWNAQTGLDTYGMGIKAAGARSLDPVFFGAGTSTPIWTSSLGTMEYSSGGSYSGPIVRLMETQHAGIARDVEFSKHWGYSVRCVKVDPVSNVAGCTYPDACNFDPEATLDDGSCYYWWSNGPTTTGCDGECISDLDGDGICDELQGCMDPLASNYYFFATVEPVGICCYETDCSNCDIWVCADYECSQTPGHPCCNGDPYDLCQYYSCYVFGTQCNDGADQDNDGVCDCNEILGCNDAAACNFDSEATEDDGSCEYDSCAGCSPVTFDGYTYGVASIGGACWFAENLRTTVFANGEVIPSNLDDWTSGSPMTGVFGGGNGCLGYSAEDYCNLSEAEVLAQYGRLYNWNAVNDSRGLCPAGWHVPSELEWNDLSGWAQTNGYPGDPALGIMSDAGWAFGSGDDAFGFGALPAGHRTNQGSDLAEGLRTEWWTTNTFVGELKMTRGVISEANAAPEFLGSGTYRPQGYGLSVRCLQD